MVVRTPDQQNPVRMPRQRLYQLDNNNEWLTRHLNLHSETVHCILSIFSINWPTGRIIGWANLQKNPVHRNNDSRMVPFRKDREMPPGTQCPFSYPISSNLSRRDSQRCNLEAGCPFLLPWSEGHQGGN